MPERARSSPASDRASGAERTSSGLGPGPAGPLPGNATAHTLMRLQQLVGNQAVVRMLARDELIGDPTDLQDSGGNQTTQHGDVGIDEAVDRPDAGRAGRQRGRRYVQVVAPETAPFQVSPEVCPVPDRIYQERQREEPGFTRVEGLQGTVDAPLVHQRANNSLYINGRPQPGDIHQYGIGDCYGLATIISIASRDPGKIQSMMSADGAGGAAVTFWRRVPRVGVAPATGPVPTDQADYEQTTVHATGQLAFELATPGVTGTAAAGPRGGGQLHGAQLHSGQRPKETEFWAAIARNNLQVHRNDTYEMGRWAPVLEKAWSRFAEVHGQYGQEGRGPGSEKSSTAGVGTTRSSGYEAIDGGWSYRVMTAFYGAAAEPGGTGGVQQVATTYAPGSNLVLMNTAAVDQLLLLQGRGEGASAQDTTAPIITATAMNDPLIGRLGQAITAAQGDPDWANIKPRTQGRIRNVATAVAAYQSALTATYATTAAATAAVGAARDAVAAACVRAIRPGETWSVLQRPTRSAATQEMLELMLDLRNAGTDHSTGQRNIYGNHVYSVRGFSVALNNAEPVPNPIPTGADRVAFYGKIDPTASTVRLQNPHHGNEPDPVGNNQPARPGDGAPAGAASDGVFTFTLDQFLRNFTSVESGVFQRS